MNEWASEMYWFCAGWSSPSSFLELTLTWKRSEISINLHKPCLVMEKAMAPHSSTLAWRIPWTEEPGGLQSMGPLRVGHDWATSFSLFTFMHWRRKWQPTPVFLPGESQGQRSLVGCCLWGHIKEKAFYVDFPTLFSNVFPHPAASFTQPLFLEVVVILDTWPTWWSQPGCILARLSLGQGLELARQVFLYSYYPLSSIYSHCLLYSFAWVMAYFQKGTRQ